MPAGASQEVSCRRDRLSGEVLAGIFSTRSAQHQPIVSTTGEDNTGGVRGARIFRLRTATVDRRGRSGFRNQSGRCECGGAHGPVWLPRCVGVRRGDGDARRPLWLGRRVVVLRSVGRDRRGFAGDDVAAANAGAVRWRAVSGLWCRRLCEEFRGIVALGAVAENGDDLGGGREVAAVRRRVSSSKLTQWRPGTPSCARVLLPHCRGPRSATTGGGRQRLGEVGMQRAELEFGGRAHWRD